MDEIKGTSEVKTFFQVLDAMFSTENAYNSLTKKDKERNFYMVNRRMAINFPLQAFKLSMMETNPEYAVDCLRMISSRYGGKKPGWLYLKTEKEKNIKTTKIKYSEEAKDFYIKMNEIDDKTFKKAVDFEPKKMQDILSKIDKQIKILSNKKSK